MRLNAMSPVTADPAGFAIDLALPSGLDVLPGTAHLTFSVLRSDTNETQSGTFALAREGTIFRVAQDDVQVLRDLQTVAQQWGAENDAATQGALGINLAPCKVGDGPAPDGRVNVTIRMQPDGVFLPLVRNGPVSAVASVDQIRNMPACP